MISNAQTWIDVTNVVLGICLFVLPWFVSGMSQGAEWNVWLTGGLIIVIAGAAVFSYAPWQEWTNLVLGAWAGISPWLFGFSMHAGAAWTHVVLGAAVLILAAIQLATANYGDRGMSPT